MHVDRRLVAGEKSGAGAAGSDQASPRRAPTEGWSGEGPANQASPRPLGEGQGVRAVSIPTGRNPYAEVAMTYLRRPLLWVLVAIILGLEVLLCPLSRFNYETVYLPDPGVYAKMPRAIDPRPGVTGLLMIYLFLFLFWQLTSHMREQFARAETHLLPDFRRVHARVTVAVMILAVLVPAGLPCLADLYGVGFISMIVLAFAATLWVVLLRSTKLILALSAAFILLAMPPTWNGLDQLVGAGFDLQTAILLAVGVTLTWLAGIRLFRLNEDMPAYSRHWTDLGWTQTSQATGRGSADAWAGMYAKGWFWNNR